MTTHRSQLTLLAAALAASCGGSNPAGTTPKAEANATPAADDTAGDTADRPADTVAALRARGPEGLEAILARYDAAEGAEKKALAAVVDRVAAQRYATVSRLYWHTEFVTAQAEARATGKPILSLRMLGDLAEDYSCANSRFFRVVLYANETVSGYLRDHFVLHWSSERPVPRVTVDYGDGRVVKTTVAGNSAHYVLDADGRPVDVLPGLYGPETFVAALERAERVARATADLDGDARAERLASFHRERVDELRAEWQRLGSNVRLLPGGDAMLAAGGDLDESILAAERATMSKAMVEMPLVTRVELGEQLSRLRWSADVAPRIASQAPEQVTLDAQSRALLVSLQPSDWAAGGDPLEGAALDALVARFEQSVTADTVFNELGIHFRIHAWFANGQAPASFAELNRKVYAELFLTPADDAWLGMATQGVFTGLPGDGIAGP